MQCLLQFIYNPQNCILKFIKYYRNDIFTGKVFTGEQALGDCIIKLYWFETFVCEKITFR